MKVPFAEGLGGFPSKSLGQGVIIGVGGKEGWAQPYQELIWEISGIALGLVAMEDIAGELAL